MGDRNEQLPDGHPQQCEAPGCSTKRRVKTPFSLCATHRQQFVRGKLVLAPETVDDPELPEDGILDARAVEVAAKGWRKVALTHRERLLATALILAQDHLVASDVISQRLSVSRTTAWQLIREVRERGIDQEVATLYR